MKRDKEGVPKTEGWSEVRPAPRVFLPRRLVRVLQPGSCPEVEVTSRWVVHGEYLIRETDITLIDEPSGARHVIRRAGLPGCVDPCAHRNLLAVRRRAGVAG